MKKEEKKRQKKRGKKTIDGTERNYVRVDDDGEC